MTTNYLQIMIDSLKKKKDILDKIIVLNETQNKILSNTEFDHDVFENNMHEKGECIDELETLYEKWLYALKNLYKLTQRPKELCDRFRYKLPLEGLAAFCQ